MHLYKNGGLYNYAKYIFIGILFIVFLGIIGCFGEDEDPIIEFENVYKVDGDYYKYYTGEIIEIIGTVKDKSNIEYLKNNGELLETNDKGRFAVIIPGGETTTSFSARDNFGNIQNVMVKLKKDINFPKIEKIWANNKIYTDGMVFGNEENIIFEVEISEDNYIEAVRFNNEFFVYDQNKGIYRYVFSDFEAGSNYVVIEAVDGAGNKEYRYLEFIYDLNGPEIKNIKINGETYVENMKYGYEDVTISYNLVDESVIKNFYVNDEDIGVVSSFQYKLSEGLNTINLKAEDFYGNLSEKQLKIYNIYGMPEIQSYYLKNNGKILKAYDENYYINSLNFYVGGQLYSGDSSLILKDVKFEERVIAELNQVSQSFEAVAGIEDAKNQTAKLEVRNEAYVATSEMINLVYDDVAPNIAISPDEELFYTDQATISMEDLFQVEVSDNYFVKDTKYYLNGSEWEINKDFDVEEENQIRIICEDYAGNKSEKLLYLNSDKLGPEFQNIMINDVPYKANMKYGEKIVKVSFDLVDDNSIYGVYVNGMLIESKEYFYHSLTEGLNQITLEAEDEYRNKSSKILEIDYIRGLPSINNIVISNSNGILKYEAGLYYSNQSNVEVQLDMYSGNDGINLSNFYINSDVADLPDSPSSTYNGDLFLELNGENIYTLRVENESYLNYEHELKLIYDTVNPKINIQPTGNIIYVNKDNIKIKDYIDVEVTDNYEKLKYIKYYVNGEEVSADEEVEIDESTIIRISTADYAGNAVSTDLNIEKDTGFPKLHSAEIENDFQKIDLINFSNAILIPYKDSDETNIILNIETYDQETGIKEIRYAGEKISNGKVVADLDNPGMIEIEDYAGNITEKIIKVVTFDKLEFVYGEDNDVSIFNPNINEYYVGDENTILMHESDTKIKIWNDSFAIPDTYSFTGDIEVKYLNEGVNEKKIYIEDQVGNRSAYYLNIYLDKEEPYINTSEVTIDKVKYRENIKVVVSHEVEIGFQTDDASGLDEILVNNGVFKGKTEDTYYYTIDKGFLNDGINIIEIIIKDKLGNQTREVLRIDVYKINPLLITVMEISERYVRLNWSVPDIPFDFNYRLYIKELGEGGVNIQRELYKSDYIVWDLDDSKSYSFQIKIEGEEFIGSSYSNVVNVTTINAVPIKSKFNMIKTYARDDDIYFKLDWKKVDKLDEHDFYAYEISVSRDKKIYKTISKISNKEVTEFDYKLPREKNNEVDALYSYYKNDNKLYHFRIRIEDDDGAISDAATISEFSYNTPPDLSMLDFTINKELENQSYIVNGSFEDISKEIDMTEYAIYRIDKVTNENKLIFSGSVDDIGKIVLSWKRDEIEVSEMLNNNKVEFVDRGLENSKIYSYRIEVKDKDWDINENSSDDTNNLSKYETDDFEIQ